ncbi:cytochrome P450 [Mycena capillaripes]|nr:cytochrome P450 [Mycena capillaripes]
MPGIFCFLRRATNTAGITYKKRASRARPPGPPWRVYLLATGRFMNTMFPTTVICALFAIYYGVRIILRSIFSVVDNIPGPLRKSFINGIMTQFHDPDDWSFQKELEEHYAQVVKIHGLLGARGLYVFDPTALQNILVQNQDTYEEMPKFLCLDRLLFGKGILSTALDEHRKYRKIMMPAFSTTNLRGMMPLFYEVAQRTRDGLIAPNVIHGGRTLDMNSILGRTSLEFIGRTGLDYSFDPMLPGQEPNDRYGQAVKAMFPTAFKLQLGIPLLPLIVKIFPPSFLRFMIDFIPSPTLHKLRDLVDLVDGTATELVRDRKASINSGKLDINDGGKDVMSLLVRSNASAESEMHLTDEELVSCTSMILFAGTGTASAGINRMFHILSMYPDIQEKLRTEILATLEYLDYDSLVALPYLDGVVREILRLYPPASPVMYREAVTDAVLPLSTPITGLDGKFIHSIAVPKGTSIYIAIAAANHNKQIWGEDALEFKPERWTNGNADSVTTKLCGIYGNTMTFLGGGRSCIGFKFAQLEMKILAFVLLRAFKFSAPDPRIKWRKGGLIPSPNVDNQPRLPILVEQLNA